MSQLKNKDLEKKFFLKTEVENGNKQEHKVSYRCSLPSPLQKGSKDWEVLIRLIHKWDHAIYQKLPKI